MFKESPEGQTQYCVNVGVRYGRLITLNSIGNDKNIWRTKWNCLCDCGDTKIIVAEHLILGSTVSCGCYRKEKNSKTQLGDKNSNWKGDKVGYTGLHRYVKSKLKRPSKCDLCKKVSKVDLANISQKYKRDITDWEWLCRSCHMKKDGRIIQLQINKKLYHEKTK